MMALSSRLILHAGCDASRHCARLLAVVFLLSGRVPPRDIQHKTINKQQWRYPCSRSDTRGMRFAEDKIDAAN